MNDRNMNSDELERKLRAYFREEDEEIQPPTGMWERLSPRLGKQERRRRLFRFFFPLSVLRWKRAHVYLAAAVGVIVLGVVAWGVFSLVGGGGTHLAPGQPEDFGPGLPATTPTVTTTPAPRPTATPTPTQTPPPRFGVRPTPTQTPPSGLGATPTPTPTLAPGAVPIPVPGPPSIPTPIRVWRLGQTLTRTSNVEVQVGRAVIREGLHGVLFYAVTAPSELEGRELLPRDVQVVGDTGASYPVIESKALTTVGRLTLAALSFSLQDWQPDTVAVQIEGLVATSEGQEPRVVEDTWRLDRILVRSDAGYPEGKISDLRGDECIVAGDAGVAFKEWQHCEPFEVWPPTPTPKPPATPTPTPAGYSQPGATPTPTRPPSGPPTAPTPTPTPTPYRTFTPKPTPTPYPPGFPAPTPTPTAVPTATPYPPGFPKPTATPTPARVPISTYSVTFKVYNAQSGPEIPYYCLNVLVSREGTVSVMQFAPVEDPDVGCPSPR